MIAVQNGIDNRKNGIFFCKYRVGKKLVTLQKYLLKPMYTNAEAVKVLDFWFFILHECIFHFKIRKIYIYIYIYIYKVCSHCKKLPKFNH